MQNTAFLSKMAMVVLISVALWGTTSMSASQEYRQTPIVLNAKDILPQDLLQGEKYKIENEVKKVTENGRLPMINPTLTQ